MEHRRSNRVENGGNRVCGALLYDGGVATAFLWSNDHVVLHRTLFLASEQKLYGPPTPRANKASMSW